MNALGVASALGGFLRLRRQQAGLGLRDAARRLGVSHAYLSRVETGKETSVPTVATLESMARAYLCDANALLCMAERVPDDVAEYVTSDPRVMAALRHLAANAKRGGKS